jgi:hypothetical protein
MSATLDADELKRLRRLATTAIVLAAVSAAVAMAALATAYNIASRAQQERTQVATTPTTLPPAQQLSASVVEAERFVLRGKAGQVRAELGVQPDDDRAELTLRAPDGTVRAELATADSDTAVDRWKRETSLLGLRDRKGKRLATLSVWDGTKGVPGTPGSFRLVQPVLAMADAAGTTRVTLSVSEDRSGLEVRDEKSSWRASLLTGENDAPFLAMWDKEGEMTVHLGYQPAEADAGPSLSLSDQEGHVRATLGSTELVTVKTGATQRTAESSLVLFDRENKVIFKAPPQ